MNEFVESYYTSQMNLYVTQIVNSFKYSKVCIEKEISDSMNKISKSQVESESTSDLSKIKEDLETSKTQFQEAIDKIQQKLVLIRKTSEEFKQFLKMSKSDKDVLAQKIFMGFLYEYLYKFEMSTTITFLKNFQDCNEVLFQIGLEKFNSFKEITEELNEQKTDKLLNWCRTNRSKLKKLKCNLEFKIQAKVFHQQREFGKSDEILEFVQNRISTLTTDSDEIYSILRYLLNEKKLESPSDLSWQSINSDFCRYYFEIEGFNKNYFLENLIQVD